MQHSLLQPSIIILFIFYCQCNIPYYNSLSSLCLSFIVNATFLTTTLYHHSPFIVSATFLATTLYHHFVYLLLLVQHSLLQLSIITLFLFYCQCNIPYYNSLSSLCLSFIVSATFLTTTLYHHFVYLLLLMQHSLLQLYHHFVSSFIVSATFLTTTLYHHFVYLLLLVQHSLLQLSIIILFIFYCQCNIPYYNSLSSFCLSFIVSATFLTTLYHHFVSFIVSTTLYHHFVYLLLLVQHSLLQLCIITLFTFYCQCNIPCYNSLSSFCLSFIVSATLLTTTLQHHLLLLQHSLLQPSIIILFIFNCQCNIPYYNSLSSFCLSFIVNATFLTTTTLYTFYCHATFLVQLSIITLFIFYLVQHSLLQPSIIILFIFYCQCNTPYYNSLSSFCPSFIVSATFLTTTLYHHFVYLLLLVQHSLLQLSIITLFIFYCQCNIPYYNSLSSFCLSFIVSATFLTTTLYHHFVYLLLLVQHSLLQLSIIIFYLLLLVQHSLSLSSFCLSFIVSATFLTTTLYHHFVYLLLLMQHSLLQLSIIILFIFYCQCNTPYYNSLSSFCLSFIVSATFLTTTLYHHFVYLLLLVQHSLLQLSIIIIVCNIPYSFIVIVATFLTTTLYHHFVFLLLLMQHSLLQLSIIILFIFYC